MGGRGVSLVLKYLQSAGQVWSISWRCQERREKGDKFCAEFFCKVEQLNYIQCAAILNTALNTSITQSSHYETHHSASIKCTNIKENNEVLLK